MNAMKMSETLTEVLDEVLYGEGGATASDAVHVKGIMHSYAFHPGRLEENRDKVRELLSQFPDAFYKNKGGGWSFLNLCHTKDGEQWTGFHAVMEQLIALGEGLGMARYMLDREIWESMPGGMPYVVIDLGEGDVLDRTG